MFVLPMNMTSILPECSENQTIGNGHMNPEVTQSYKDNQFILMTNTTKADYPFDLTFVMLLRVFLFKVWL